jgi:dTDP-4-dehydrorhamnose 3,5-epimerase
MRFLTTTLPGVWRIELEPRADERGFLARTYCDEEFAARGLNTAWPQATLTLTRKRGMLRGIHYQDEPAAETKLIRCATGAVFDVLVDIRPHSPAFGKWEAFELTETNNHQLYVPGGFAHGVQCLTDNCRMFYQISKRHVPELSRGVRWDDPELAIAWPVANPLISHRDQHLPLLRSLK